MSDEFYRIRRLPPYVFAEVNAMKAAARARGEDIVERVALLRRGGTGRAPSGAPLGSVRDLLRVPGLPAAVVASHRLTLPGPRNSASALSAGVV